MIGLYFTAAFDVQDYLMPILSYCPECNYDNWSRIQVIMQTRPQHGSQEV